MTTDDAGNPSPYVPAYHGPAGSPPPRPRNGWGLAALVLNCVALLLAFIPFIGLAAIPLCLAGVAAAIVGLTPARRRRGMAMPVVALVAFLPTIPVAMATTVVGGAVWSFFDGLDADAQGSVAAGRLVKPGMTAAQVEKAIRQSGGTAEPQPDGTVVRRYTFNEQTDTLQVVYRDGVVVDVVDGQVRRLRNAFDAIQSGHTLADVTRSLPDAYKTAGQSQTRPDGTGVHTWAHGPGLPDLQVEERGGKVIAKSNYRGERFVVPPE